MAELKQIEARFDRIGARANIRRLNKNSLQIVQRPVAINIVRDGPEECFDIELAADVRLAVLDLSRGRRQLLLSASNWLGEDRFLCGHDEHHWFVAALPGEPRAEHVEAATEALKPNLVRTIERRKRRGMNRRKSDVFFRQGEWFFIPWPHASIDRARIQHNATLTRRAGSKPHFCEFLFEDGQREYECDRYPKLAFFESEYKNILRTRRKANQWNWRPLPFHPDIYVRGWITHADHSPLCLAVWHRVQLNQEADQLAMAKLNYRD